MKSNIFGCFSSKCGGHISSMMNYSNMIEETSETPWDFGIFRDRWNWMELASGWDTMITR